MTTPTAAPAAPDTLVPVTTMHAEPLELESDALLAFLAIRADLDAIVADAPFLSARRVQTERALAAAFHQPTDFRWRLAVALARALVADLPAGIAGAAGRARVRLRAFIDENADLIESQQG